jgi:hypothetical protein
VPAESYEDFWFDWFGRDAWEDVAKQPWTTGLQHPKRWPGYKLLRGADLDWTNSRNGPISRAGQPLE